MMLAAWAVLAFSLATVMYVYVGFPCWLYLLQLRRKYKAPAPAESDAELPSVSMIVAAHNEEEVVAQKVENGLRIDYPAEKLEFVFASDGSADGTNEILRGYESERVRVIYLPERRGKAAALASALPQTSGDILVLSDANTYYRPDSLRRLVRHFRNPEVGLVTGDVRLLASNQAFGAGEGLYYRYERWLQRMETSFWSTVAIDGAMYGLRRPLFRMAYGGVPDDLVIGMSVGCQGYRLIYDPQAIAEENPSSSGSEEFNRKIRIVASAIQALLDGQGVPSWTNWRLLWVFLSHKVLRWFVPVFLMLMLAASGTLAANSIAARGFLIAQAVFYGLACLSWSFPRLDSRLVRVPYYFSLVNMAALVGIWRGLRRRQGSMWKRTTRIRVEL
jgi:cellulose synthase/poly-beta-1,6-N-acetylglucosamine synthase-like glycosyltransferase